MKFVTFSHPAGERVGVVSPSGDQVYDLTDLGFDFSDMIDLITRWSPELPAAIGQAMDRPETNARKLAEVELLAPIPQPRDIIAVSQNYASHVRETCLSNGVEYKNPEHCAYFFRRVNRAVAPGAKLDLHSAITSELDYEVELAFVIGRECRNVSPDEALEYVFGYTISNDISARDIQRNLPQYSYAKGLDDTTPLGPWIVTRDEIADPHRLAISLKVNGELRQQGNTDDMIFDIPYVIADLTKGMTLYPGDVIITGTPSGIGAALKPPQFLKQGDIIECEIEGIGRLQNVMSDQR